MTDSITALLWLHLLRTGKPLTAKELADLGHCARDTADRLLCVMARRGVARAHRSPARKNGRAYSVDAACVLPRGVTVTQVLEAVRLMPAEVQTPVPVPGPGNDLPPRGKYGHIGQVSSVFALGG